MKGQYYELKRFSNEDMADLERKLCSSFDNLCNNYYCNIEKKDNVEVLLFVCEKYYFRNGSMAALTIQIVSDHYEQKALIVATGGGQGLLNISYGANSNFANKAKEILETYGFR